MSDDEVMVFLVAGILTMIALWRIALPLLNVKTMRPWWGKMAIIGTFFVSGAILLTVLMKLAAPVVHGDDGYIALFFTVGIACTFFVLNGMAILGISWRDDALERKNPAAVDVTIGAILGSTFLFAGSNIGEGPTIWTTLGPAALALLVWLLLWALLQSLTRIAEAVTVERDLSSGLRLSAMLLSNGLILGHAAAGNWVSTDDTIHSFLADGWPVMALTMLTIILQWKFCRAPAYTKAWPQLAISPPRLS